MPLCLSTRLERESEVRRETDKEEDERLLLQGFNEVIKPAHFTTLNITIFIASVCMC
jgi:hypothetical protein